MIQLILFLLLSKVNKKLYRYYSNIKKVIAAMTERVTRWRTTCSSIHSLTFIDFLQMPLVSRFSFHEWTKTNHVNFRSRKNQYYRRAAFLKAPISSLYRGKSLHLSGSIFLKILFCILLIGRLLINSILFHVYLV